MISIEPSWSWSMTRSCRSDCRTVTSSSMIFGDRVGLGAHRAGAGRAAERPHAAHHALRAARPACSGTNGCSSSSERVAAHDDLALAREVERHDRDVLFVDVLPDVELGPVRQREHADALAWAEPAVEVVPQLRPLPLRDPTAPARRAARTPAPWRASAPRRAARRRTRRRSSPRCSASSSARVFSRPQQRWVPTANGCVPSAIAAVFVWTISRAPTWPAYQSRNSIISRNL